MNDLKWFCGRIFYVFTLVAVLPLPASALEFSYTQGSEKGSEASVMEMRGNIVKGDYDRFIKIIKENDKIPKVIWISSNGGDVFEAMKIGRLARKAGVTVSNGIPCNSACFLVLVGGVDRLMVVADGKSIGIHRPYYDKEYFSNLSYDAASKKHEELDRKVRKYLISMGVAEYLVNKMMATPSDNLFYLSWQEFNDYVGQYSAAFYEWIGSKCSGYSQKFMGVYFGLLAFDIYVNSLKEYEESNKKDLSIERTLQNLKPYYDEYKGISEEERGLILRKGEKIWDCADRAKSSALKDAYDDL